MYRGTVISRLAGGVMKCRNDKWYTLADNGKGLCDLICCTEQDLSEKYHNRYLEIIFPADRDRVSQGDGVAAGGGPNHGAGIPAGHRGRKADLGDGPEHSRDRRGRAGIYLYTSGGRCLQSHKAMEELQMSAERYKIILDQTKDVIFEWKDCHG